MLLRSFRILLARTGLDFKVSGLPLDSWCLLGVSWNLLWIGLKHGCLGGAGANVNLGVGRLD